VKDFSLIRKVGDSKIESSDLQDIFKNWQSDERWLFIAPHDDDLCMGSGLLMQKALAEGIPVRAIITTDGRMGYGSSISKENIVATRKAETLDSFNILGIDDVHWLDFPDCSLHLYSGAREAVDGDPCIIGGNTGIQNAYTSQLRDFKPTRVFVPAGSDLHPDHKTVYQEILISLFHSAGDIWPQLGEPLSKIPDIYEMAIYCDFPSVPTIKLTTSDAVFNKKLDSILAYKSQKQIESLVNNLKSGGAVEYFREVLFDLYGPENYKNLF